VDEGSSVIGLGACALTSASSARSGPNQARVDGPSVGAHCRHTGGTETGWGAPSWTTAVVGAAPPMEETALAGG
jgi:hypothetical protein